MPDVLAILCQDPHSVTGARSAIDVFLHVELHAAAVVDGQITCRVRIEAGELNPTPGH